MTAQDVQERSEDLLTTTVYINIDQFMKQSKGVKNRYIICILS